MSKKTESSKSTSSEEYAKSDKEIPFFKKIENEVNSNIFNTENTVYNNDHVISDNRDEMMDYNNLTKSNGGVYIDSDAYGMHKVVQNDDSDEAQNPIEMNKNEFETQNGESKDYTGNFNYNEYDNINRFKASTQYNETNKYNTYRKVSKVRRGSKK